MTNYCFHYHAQNIIIVPRTNLNNQKINSNANLQWKENVISSIVSSILSIVSILQFNNVAHQYP